MDDFWYLAHNADTGQEGMVLAREMKIIKHLPGQDIVVSGQVILLVLYLAWVFLQNTCMCYLISSCLMQHEAKSTSVSQQ